jgi:phosphoribosylformimino-5-aminoimidazole carboxamide ribotide isomerase
MLVIPAIDLKNGKCVRLLQGRMEDCTVYSDDPAEVARRYEESGAEWIHVVDLDGSVGGAPRNHEALAAVVKSVGVPVEFGGGIRNEQTVEACLEIGVKRVIMGTTAFQSPELFSALCRKYPGKVALALDARNGMVAIKGWTENTRKRAVDMAVEFQDRGAAVIIFTDIARDGMQTGVNIEETAKLASSVKVPVIASGGVASLEDITRLLPLEELGVIGVITGKAILSGTLDLGAAIAAAQPR